VIPQRGPIRPHDRLGRPRRPTRREEQPQQRRPQPQPPPKDRQLDRQRLGEGYRDFSLVFASEVGTPLNPSNVVHRFKRALRRAGLSESYSPHSLRHANATLQLASGVATKVASERLGHSNVQITQDLYQHVLKELDETAATKIGDVLRAERSKAI
jgi:integrase